MNFIVILHRVSSNISISHVIIPSTSPKGTELQCAGNSLGHVHIEGELLIQHSILHLTK